MRRALLAVLPASQLFARMRVMKAVILFLLVLSSCFAVGQGPSLTVSKEEATAHLLNKVDVPTPPLARPEVRQLLQTHSVEDIVATNDRSLVITGNNAVDTCLTYFLARHKLFA